MTATSLRVPAQVEHNRCGEVPIDFDAAPWLAAAADKDILELARRDFLLPWAEGGMKVYEAAPVDADYLAGLQSRAGLSVDIGLEVQVDPAAVLLWLQANRPHLYQPIADNELEEISDLQAQPSVQGPRDHVEYQKQLETFFDGEAKRILQETGAPPRASMPYANAAAPKKMPAGVDRKLCDNKYAGVRVACGNTYLPPRPEEQLHVNASVPARPPAPSAGGVWCQDAAGTGPRLQFLLVARKHGAELEIRDERQRLLHTLRLDYFDRALQALLFAGQEAEPYDRWVLIRDVTQKV